MKVKVIIDKQVKKLIKSKSTSIKSKYINIVTELESIPYGGPVYTSLKGERLINLEKSLKCEYQIHSVEMQYRIRLVWDLYTSDSGYVDNDGVEYDALIYITDLGNHLHHGIPYVKLFNM